MPDTTTIPRPPKPWEAGRAARTLGPLAFFGTLACVFVFLASIGLPTTISRPLGVVAAISNLMGGLITPGLYLLGAIGLGRPMVWLLARTSKARFTLQMLLGVAVMLWLSHFAGVLGLLNVQGVLGPIGARTAAWAIVGVGLVLLADQVVRGELRPERWPVFPAGVALWAPALGILFIAACSPPGALWASEFGAYDALSYHLQLAKEWAAGPTGRVWPGEHNVYSFLPSYMEAAFAHLGVLSGGFNADVPLVDRMLAEDGYWVYACQFLHVGMGLIAALAIARLVRTLAAHAGLVEADHRLALLGGLAGAALLLGTPWTIVVGSLAYNELAMLAMIAGALLSATDGDLSTWRRGAIAGLLVGIAASAKPTALFLAGPMVALALVAWPARSNLRMRTAAIIAAAGTVTGLAAIAPWLIRNTLASGNPVFPFAASTFGRGHWTEEQVARYARNHAAEGSLIERLELLLSSRGFTHEQWAFTPWMALLALVMALVWRPTRWAASVLAAGAALQLIAWITFTHLQSRFLLPVLVPMAGVFGLGVCATLAMAQARVRGTGKDASPRTVPWLAAMVVGVLPLTAAGWSAINFMRQLDAQPNERMPGGAGSLSGTAFAASYAQAEPAERARFLSEAAPPIAYVNLGLRLSEDDPSRDAAGNEPRGLYLLGDAAALYYLDALGPLNPNRPAVTHPSTHVIYHTTWDRSLLGDAIDAARMAADQRGGAASPIDPADITRFLRENGIGHVLVNYAELARLIDKDRYYDPRVVGDLVVAWLVTRTSGVASIRKWTQPVADPTGSGSRGQVTLQELFRLDAPAEPGQ